MKRNVLPGTRYQQPGTLPATIIGELRSHANPDNIAGMARFGIRGGEVLGVPMPVLRAIGREHRRDHYLALALWASGIHEARILASIVDDPAKVDDAQLESWVRDFDSWDVCDQCCMNLIRKTPFAWEKALAWSEREGEFVKRAAFTLMATLAVHDRDASDAVFACCLPVIERESTDARNFVKKAVNWALRQIGKRNDRLRAKAIATAKRIAKLDAPSARWIARDALRELEPLSS